MPAYALAAATGDAAIPLALLLVFVSAKLMSELFERLGQPGLVGAILAGVLLGPHVLGWLAPAPLLGALAELGVMFLLFRVGLEVRASELLRVGGTALLVAVAGVALPFALGWGLAAAWGMVNSAAIFVAAALVATSVGVTAHVLEAQGLLHERASRIILAAAIIDDVLGLIVLAVVSSVARDEVNVLGLAVTALVAAGFTFIVARFGTPTMKRLLPRVEARLRGTEAQFAVAMSLLFALALLAVYAGVAAIVGAFLAGLALSEVVGERVHQLTLGVTELLVPFFLVGIGLAFNGAALVQGSTAWFALAVVAAAVVSKLAGCALGAARMGRRNAFRVGAGMVPRGEVGMIVAQIGLRLGILGESVYGTVVVMSIATTLLAPPLIRFAYRDAGPRRGTRQSSAPGLAAGLD
jgi:Kef-type K+ transport system membrane component KefB